MKIFAPIVELPGFAQAELVRVERASHGMVGRYLLQPIDVTQYQMRIADMRENLGRLYAPVPGLWSTYVFLDREDELELHIGLEVAFGKALIKAHTTLKGVCKCIVPAYQVRAMAMGFLDKYGM